MSKVFLLIGQIITALIIGFLTGLFSLLFLVKKEVFLTNFSSSLGFKKPQIIGFRPFWLIEKDSPSYQNQITQLSYFSLIIDSDGQLIKLKNPQEEEPGWTMLQSGFFQQQLEQTKKAGGQLSLLIHNSNEEKISLLLERPILHAQNLIASAAPIMRRFGFTDLNLDIESFVKADPDVQKKFILFVQEVKQGLDRENLGSLTVDIVPISLVEKRLTKVKEVGQIADFIVLMTYDYHYLYSLFAGPVAPVGGAGQVREYDVETTVQEALKSVPPEKIILGIPLYGYQWETLSDQPGAAVIPGGASVFSSRRIAQKLADCFSCCQGFNSQAKQPYLIIPQNDYYQQVYYEDQASIKEKLELAEEYNLAGIALWALGYEDNQILQPLEEYKNSPDFYPPLPIINQRRLSFF